MKPTWRAAGHGYQVLEIPQWTKSFLSCFAAHGGQPLPQSVRYELESYFGLSLADVKVFTGPAPDILEVDAYACGETICFAPDKLDYASELSLRLLCHELAHVVQARLGHVRASEGEVIFSHELEQQARRVAAGFRCHARQREWSAGQLAGAARASSHSAIQCQARGLLNTNYIGLGIHPAVPAPPLGIAFSGANCFNEVWGSRALALTRAKSLLGLPGNAARRTYHWYTVNVPDNHAHAHGEGLSINGRQLLGPNANQRTGRYYDFGRGRLIVEHTDDPNSTTQVTGHAAVQRGHFHIAAYDGARGMYMPYRAVGGVVLAGQHGQPGPDRYEIDRRYQFEVGDIHAGGAVEHHHIYYY